LPEDLDQQKTIVLLTMFEDFFADTMTSRLLLLLLLVVVY